jgi:TetR/AcrR family transcriptional regulator, regulator of mycofactocin system
MPDSENAAPAPKKRLGRPPAASRQAVEELALALMLERGYDAVSIDDVAEAAGIGRTTFFRYFGSKPGVIWGPFDDTIRWLDEALDREPEAGDDVLEHIERAVLTSSLLGVEASDVWLERFHLLDTAAALRAEAYEHWEAWKGAVARRLERSLGQGDTLAWAIAAACQACFVAELRRPTTVQSEPEALMRQVELELHRILGAFRPLLAAVDE